MNCVFVLEWHAFETLLLGAFLHYNVLEVTCSRSSDNEVNNVNVGKVPGCCMQASAATGLGTPASSLFTIHKSVRIS